MGIPALVLAKLLAVSAIQPASQSIAGADFGCIALSRAETRYHRAHIFVCVAPSPSGEIVGAMLRSNGTVRCDVSGTYDGTCVTLGYCGETRTACR